METHANYTRVGLFVLIGFVGFIAFIIWLSNASFGQYQKIYDIYFSGSVSGLKKESIVQYRGVPIGTVNDISITTQDIEQIHVSVSIDSAIPIKKDALATLETQGLTGVSYIQIKGNTKDSPLLTVKKGKTYPIIPSKSSFFEEVTSSVPELLSHVNGLVKDLRSVLNDENRKVFSQTLHNIERITEFFNPNKDVKESFLKDMGKTMDSVENTFNEMRAMSKELKEVLKENRQNIKNFSSVGLDDLNRFFSEGRDTLSSLKRVTDSLERSPSRFFYNDPNQGVPTQ